MDSIIKLLAEENQSITTTTISDEDLTKQYCNNDFKTPIQNLITQYITVADDTISHRNDANYKDQQVATLSNGIKMPLVGLGTWYITYIEICILYTI